MTKVSEKVATRQSGGHLKTTRCVNSGALVDSESSLFREGIKLMRQRQRWQRIGQEVEREQCCWQPDDLTSSSSNKKRKKKKGKNSSLKLKYKYKNSTFTDELIVTTLGISSTCFNRCWHKANNSKVIQPAASFSHRSSRKKASSYLCHLMSHFILYSILILQFTNQSKPQLLEAAKYRQNIPPNIGYNDDAITATATNLEATRKLGQPLSSTTFHNSQHQHHHHHHQLQQQQQPNHQLNNNTSPTKTSIERSRFQKQQQLLSWPAMGFNVFTLVNSLSNVTGDASALEESAMRKAAALNEVRKKRHLRQRRHASASDQDSPSKEPQSKRQVIHAMLKGQVQLNCNIQPSEQDDAVSLVLWYKDKSTVPIYSLDARSSTIQEARHKPGPWLEGRSSLKVFSKRNTIRNKRQLDSEPLNLIDEETFHSGDLLKAPTSSSTPFLSTHQQSARHSWIRKRHRRHRNHPERSSQSNAADQELDSKLAKFASVWSSIIRSGPTNLAGLREVDDLEKRGVPFDTDSDQAAKQVQEENSDDLLQQQQRTLQEMPPSRPLSKHQFTFLASQPSSASSMALVASQQSSRGDQANTEQQLIANLQIDSLSSEDNGVYLCRVDFRKARSRTQEVVLKIIVPPDKPIIRDLTRTFYAADNSATSDRHTQPPTAGSTQVIGPHNENSRLVLECETQGGYPEPILSWWRDGRLVDDSYEIISSLDGLVIAKHSAFSDKDRDREGGLIKEAGHLNSSGEEDNLSSSNEPSLDQSETNGSSMKQHLTGTEDSLANSSFNLNADRNNQDNTALDSGNNKQVAQNRLIRNRLELSGLTRADLLANYSCQAWNTKLSEPPTSSIMIDMNLRPIKVQIENDRLSVVADKPLEIICRAFGSRPAALISWYKGNSKLSPEQTILGQHSSSANMAPSDETMTSSNNNSEQTITQVHIEELISSSDSNITTSTLTFVPQIDDGGSIITCKAENPFIQANGLETSKAVTELELAATNNLVANSIEDSWKLDVHYLPRVKLAFGEKLNSQIQEGHDVYFECSIKAHPNAHEVRWWFDGKELESNTSNRVIISNQSLVLQKVNRNQRGRYTCSAINAVGESHSNSVHLRVQYAPFCRDTPESNYLIGGARSIKNTNDAFTSAINQQRFKTLYGAARLESVKVYCHIDADPADSTSYKWAFVSSGTTNNNSSPTSTSANKPEFSGQQLIYLDQSLITNSDGDNPLVSVATYTPRSELDYGTLLCWGQNSLGQQSEPCTYQIVPAERPDPVRNCRLLNASDTQLTVACEPGYDGGIDQSFQMEVYDATKHDLVANVSSNSANIIAISLSGKPLSYWPSPEDTNKASNLNLSDDSSDDDSNMNSSSNGRGKVSGNEPASLVSEPIVSRQQKQRHSLQISSSMNSKNGPKSPQQQLHQQSQVVPLETVFITDPILRPATDYFLSIYSSNSKGSSKPVAFTATTMNLSTLSADSILGASSTFANGNTRDGRRADASHLLNDVLALSWNPFLLVCAITVALFVMFASITFAMMKYVDFTSAISPQQHHDNKSGPSTSASASANENSSSPYLAAARSCLSSSGSAATTTTADNLKTLNRSRANCNNNGSSFSKHLTATSSEFDDEDDSISLQTNNNGSGAMKKQRKRVVTVATTVNKNTSSTDKAHNIHLNGIYCKERSSLLNGSYLKFKLSQLTGSPNKAGGQRIKLKQSTSDNYLNQMGLNKTVGVHLDSIKPTATFASAAFQQPRHHHHNHNQYQSHQQQQQQQFLLQHQISGAICGTLPRNLPSSWKPVHATTNFYQPAGVGVGQPSVAFTSEDHQGLIPQLHLLQSKDTCHQAGGNVTLENPYGIRSNGSITGSTTSPDAYATTTTYSASTSCGSNQPTHQSAPLFGLQVPLPALAGTGSGTGPTGEHNQAEKYGQYSQSVANESASNGGYPLSEAGRVEQLVISGKQYIHQTSVNRAPYPASSRGQQQRHLQMTSGAYTTSAGPTSVPASLTGDVGASKQQQPSRNNSNNPCTATSGGLQSMVKDYLSQQQQNYLQNQQALVCINHATGNNQTGLQTKQRLSNSDQIVVANNERVASHDLANAQTVDFQASQQYSHFQEQTCRTTSENYPNTAALNKNPASCCSSGNEVGATKTSDLGDELPANECENNRTFCHHVAHLTLIDGCADNNLGASANGGGVNTGQVLTDSDGMSSETQRSFTTNGSPSSGVAEMEHHQQYRASQLLTHYKLATSSSNSSATNHHYNGSIGQHQATNSSEQDQLLDICQVGGSVIGVNKQQTTSDSDEPPQHQQTMHNPRANQKTNNFGKNGKKIYEPNQEFVQTSVNRLVEHPQLEHYTMYVDEVNNNVVINQGDNIAYGDYSNNIQATGEFYVLPVDDETIISSDGFGSAPKARVRLVGANSGNAQLNYRPQNETNLATNFSSNNSTANDQANKTNELLQTDV